MKIVLLVLAVLAAVWLLRGAGRRRDAAPGPRPAAPPKPAPATAMVACAHCGVHLPRTEALMSPGGETFCGDAHRQAGAKGPSA